MLNTKKIILNESFILPDYNLSISKTNFLVSPLFVSLLLFLTTLFLLVFKKNTLIWFNTLSITYGIIGIIILALWFLTAHSTTKINMNILWANPLLIVYPWIHKKLKRVLNYIGMVMLLSFIIVAIAQFQAFNLCFYILASSLLPIYAKQLLTLKI